MKVTIYGHETEYRLLRDHGTGTIDVERISDGKCFRISGLAVNSDRVIADQGGYIQSDDQKHYVGL